MWHEIDEDRPFLRNRGELLIGPKEARSTIHKRPAKSWAPMGPMLLVGRK